MHYKSKQYSWLIIGWIILAVIPSSLTNDSPHMMRATTMLPILLMTVAYGVVEVSHQLNLIKISSSQKKVSTGIIKYTIYYFLFVIAMVASHVVTPRQMLFITAFLLATVVYLSRNSSKLVNIINLHGLTSNFKTGYLVGFLYLAITTSLSASYMYTYFMIYPKCCSQNWQYPYKQVADYVKQNYDSYDKFIISTEYGSPHEFILFYLGWDPEKYQNNKDLFAYKDKDQIGWLTIERFDKFYFLEISGIPKKEKLKLHDGSQIDMENSLVFVSISERSRANIDWKKWKLVDNIRLKSGEIAFEIYKLRSQ